VEAVFVDEMGLDHTHEPSARSWVEAANSRSTDFPIQNLPLALFKRKAESSVFRGGVAIGDCVLDLSELCASGVLGARELAACLLAAQESLGSLFAAGPETWRAVRHAIFRVLSADASEAVQSSLKPSLVPMSDVEYDVPAVVRNYSDFYTSYYHAHNIGSLTVPDNPLPPNFHWMPIAYHGRASSVVIGGGSLRRPRGQYLIPGSVSPVFGPCKRLDYELELGAYVGAGNALGETIRLSEAESHIFGLCLLNDWSARDVQFWEMVPLGPFLGKSFCTTVSPWVVTMEALKPFRVPAPERQGVGSPLPYLESTFNRYRGAFDIRVSSHIHTSEMRRGGAAPEKLSMTNFRHQYWTYAQMLAHHTVNGCNLLPGDLIGSGTISGPNPDEAGALIELTAGGSKPLTFSNGERRTFVEDEDEIILRGWCEAPGRARIGFGENRARVTAALKD
jgi:fumarylacetoacetase